MANCIILIAGMFLLILPAVLGDLRRCYFPDGTRALNDRPCTSEITPIGGVCCRIGYACLSNGLCRPPEKPRKGFSDWKTPYVRGSCVDIAWKNCASVCRDPDRDDLSGSMGLAWCRNTSELLGCTLQNLPEIDCEKGEELRDYTGELSVITTIQLETTSLAPSSTSGGAVNTTMVSSSDQEATQIWVTTSTGHMAAEGTATATDIESGKDSSGWWSKDRVIVVGSCAGGSLTIVAVIVLVFWGRRRKRQGGRLHGSDDDKESPSVSSPTRDWPAAALWELPSPPTIHEAPTTWTGSAASTTHQVSPTLPPPQELAGSPAEHKYE